MSMGVAIIKVGVLLLVCYLLLRLIEVVCFFISDCVRFVSSIIRRIVVYRNRELIEAELEKSEKLLNNFGKRITREEAIKQGKNYTGIL